MNARANLENKWLELDYLSTTSGMMPASSSWRATSIDDSPAFTSMSGGAPYEIWSERAPRMRASSNLLSVCADINITLLWIWVGTGF